ncbi:hypothetical protein [Devosia sediminis]|uniref:DUF1795 domain-containing protein n=1 Tax=Devosia sediminis TaxID=2798801 RepID=A0A934J396_9HYPH|nr:hypothetical protein [Devosia sediminis]MBJ3786884.1 hypothetical protein [Devosia sediminis]
MIHSRLTLLPLALLLCGFTSFDRFADPETGLSIEPPNSFLLIDLADYSAQSTAKSSVGVYPHTTTDLANPPTPYCVLTLHEREDTEGKTQDELNARMRDPESIDALLGHFGQNFTMREDEAVSLDGVDGHQFTFAAPGPDAENHDYPVHVATIFDTPPGRVTLACQTTNETLTTDLVTLDLIRDNLSLPAADK